MSTSQVMGPVVGTGRSWRERFPAYREKVSRIKAPHGRNIAWEGSEIWAYRDRPKTITEAFRKNLAQRPDAEAYVFYPGGRRMTWRETGECVTRAAFALQAHHGLRKGDRIGLLIHGAPEYVIGYLAASALGAIAVPVNLGLSPDGIADQVNKVALKCIICSADVYRQKLLPVQAKFASNPSIIIAEADDVEYPGKVTRFDRLTAHPAAGDIKVEVDEWDICAVAFTSGTTGAPKGTMTMHINAVGCALTVIDMIKGLTVSDVNICMPPLYHNTAVYTDFMPALISGGKMVVLETFTPLDALRVIEKEKPTWCVAAPIMLWMMMNHPEFSNFDCASLRKFAFGGHASSESFIRQLQTTFNPSAMVNAGSVSESTATGFALPTEDAITKITSCGLATACTEIAIFDEDGRELVEPDHIGEVGYKGQQTNAGYWEDPERTAEVFRKDGYVLSGDWAKLDEDGYLWLLDRKKDMIVRGGQNVYCIEVENKLYLHDDVLQVAVVGVPDHVFSERVKAVIVLKPGHVASAAAIRSYCERTLAKYERPEYIVFAKAIPRNPAGKTLKKPLIDFWGDEATGGTSDAAAKLRMFCSTIPEGLMKHELFRFETRGFTPAALIDAVEQKTDLGERVANRIAGTGLASLLRPDEARFRR